MNRLYSYPRRRQSRGVVFSPAFVCLSVCLSVRFPHDISRTDATRTTKLDVEMFHNESWKGKPFIWRSKGQSSRSQKQFRRGYLYSCAGLVSDEFYLEPGEL